MTSGIGSAPQYLGSVITRTHWWGVVSDIATPALATATMEMVGPDAAIVVDAFMGEQGPPGKDADIVKMQYQDAFDDPSEIPVSTLTDSETDIGKAWWIGNMVYVWSGAGLQVKNMGTAGPPGAVPVITPSVNLIDPDGTTPSSIVVGGTPSNPTWLLNLKCPRGPQGTNAEISTAVDMDTTYPPELGDAIIWNGTKWQPEPVGTIVPQVFSIPEGAFNSFSGVATLQNIAHISLPAQDWSWIPLVWGKVRAVGLEVTTDPLTLGAAVFLGADGTTGGTLVGRGFGNISTFANISPHFSTPSATTTAVAPGNGIAVVPAHHTGTAGDLYVDLWNEGALASYLYNNKDSQLLVVQMPVSG